MSLYYLSSFLSRYYGKKVIARSKQGFVLKVELNRLLVNATSSSQNPFTYASCIGVSYSSKRAVMTGITRVSKESIFSDLNNLQVVTTTAEKYAESFGFTEEEVFAALDEFGMTEKKNEVKEWYDGFTFGDHADIYNPWSILNYLDKGQVGVYWANTSSNSLVGALLREGSRQTKLEFEELMRGHSLRMEIDEQIVYNQLYAKKNAVWSLLLASGYLKVVDKEFVYRTGRWYYTLVLTNREVHLMFEDLVSEWFTGPDDSYNDFITALLMGDLKRMNIYMSRVALTTYKTTGSSTQLLPALY